MPSPHDSFYSFYSFSPFLASPPGSGRGCLASEMAMKPCRTVSYPWASFGILCLFVFGTFGISGCVHLPTCKNSHLPTQERSLRGMWNTLRYIKEQRLKARWASRFLDHLLGGTPYLLKVRGKAFVVVDPSDPAHPCRVNIKQQQQQIQDATFLTKLYELKQKNNLNLRAYMYTSPKEYTVSNTKAEISGGNCRSIHYRVEFSYWRSISTKYSQATWPEACKLGQKLRKWDSCLPGKDQTLFRERMKKICK